MTIRKLYLAMFLILVVFVAARVSSPYVLTNYVNSLINQQQGVSGSVGGVSLQVIFGKYSIRDIQLYQSINNEDRELVFIEELDIRLNWKALFRGEFVSTMVLKNPSLFIRDNTEKDEPVTEAVLDEKTWLGFARDLTPVSIEQLEIVNGAITFSASDQDQQGKLSVHRLNGVVENLHNNNQSQLLTDFKFQALVNRHADLSISGRLNPNSIQPEFDLDIDMTTLPSTQTKTLVDLYAPFDIDAGKFDLAAEAKAKQGKLNGYVKVGIHDLSVFSFKDDILKGWSDPDDTLIQPFLESFSGLVAEILENKDKSLVATKIPLNGSLDKPEISYLSALTGLIKNAFFEAYKLEVDNIVRFEPNDSQTELSTDAR